MKNHKSILRLFTCVLTAFILFGCNPCKRASKLLTRHPKCLSVDSVEIHDTITVDGVQHDTLFKLSEVHDTLVIKKDRLTIKHYYDHKTDSVYIDGECEEEIIYRTRKVPVTVTVEKPVTFFDKLKGWIFWLLVLVGLYYGYNFIK